MTDYVFTLPPVASAPTYLPYLLPWSWPIMLLYPFHKMPQTFSYAPLLSNRNDTGHFTNQYISLMVIIHIDPIFIHTLKILFLDCFSHTDIRLHFADGCFKFPVWNVSNWLTCTWFLNVISNRFSFTQAECFLTFVWPGCDVFGFGQWGSRCIQCYGSLFSPSNCWIGHWGIVWWVSAC